MEDWFHSQKPQPFDSEFWDLHRVDVMRRGIVAKFGEPSLRELLLSTGDHPLASVKNDGFWGIDPINGGENMLAVILMGLRNSIVL